MKTVLLALLLILGATTVAAQEPPAAQPGEFFDILADCLDGPERSVHGCAVDYLDITSAPDQPAARSVIKGKYNTCHLYPDTELKGDDKGYECFDNVTGKCVSGDCCTLFSSC